MESEADGSFESELFNALKKCGLSDRQPDNKDELIQEIQEAFVLGNPRAWWMHLKRKPKILHCENDDGYSRLNELVPSSTNEVWFIVDEDNENKYIFYVPINAVPDIVRECRYFEYYIVSHDLSWMLVENDHGDLLFVTNTSLNDDSTKGKSSCPQLPTSATPQPMAASFSLVPTRWLSWAERPRARVT